MSVIQLSGRRRAETTTNLDIGSLDYLSPGKDEPMSSEAYVKAMD